VSTSPVLTPIRPSTPSSGNASRISTAARHARSASSSCATGTPNTAITASPMNFYHRALVRLDDRLHSLEVVRQQPLQRLGIHRLAERRRADDVAEQHRHDLPVCAGRHEPRLEQSAA